MSRGQQIVRVETDSAGRRAYLCQEKKNNKPVVIYRCLRLTHVGWCQVNSRGPCRFHHHGDTPASQRRKGYHRLGDDIDLPDGYEFVGYIPSKGGATYFLRTPRGGVIRPACLRQRSLSGRIKAAEEGGSFHAHCLRAPLWINGEHRGACLSHRTKSTKYILRRLMDPTFASVLSVAAASDPAVEQIQTRVDTINRAWFFLLETIAERHNLLEDIPDLKRDEGVTYLVNAIYAVSESTAVQGKLQVATFKSTGIMWAQQAYSLRLAEALAEAAAPEGASVCERIGHNIHRAMLNQGLIASKEHLPTRSQATSNKLVPYSTVSAMTTPESFVARNTREKRFIAALATKGRQGDYAAVVVGLGDRIYSLYPLINVVDALIEEETIQRSPADVLVRLQRAQTRVMAEQSRIDQSLNIVLTERQAKAISASMISAVLEALRDETHERQAAILERFLELKDGVELPRRADSAAQEVIDAMAVAVQTI